MSGDVHGFLNAMNKMVDRSFNSRWKFETAVVVSKDDDSSRTNTTKGYRTENLEGVGTADRDGHNNGDSVIQVNGSGPGSIPINLGASPWITG